MDEVREHWERVYQEKSDTEVSWYQASPAMSLSLIDATGVDSSSGVIDVGGGTARLVDELLIRGFSDVTILDISDVALARARGRLGAHSANVEWLQQDVVRFHPQRRWSVWHDRAVFHFLTEAEQRRGYRTALEAAVGEGGHVIIATFALSGPPRCSGRPVVRYSAETLLEELGPRFQLAESQVEAHETPAGRIQDFIYCRFEVR